MTLASDLDWDLARRLGIILGGGILFYLVDMRGLAVYSRDALRLYICSVSSQAFFKLAFSYSNIRSTRPALEHSSLPKSSRSKSYSEALERKSKSLRPSRHKAADPRYHRLCFKKCHMLLKQHAPYMELEMHGGGALHMPHHMPFPQSPAPRESAPKKKPPLGPERHQPRLAAGPQPPERSLLASDGAPTSKRAGCETNVTCTCAPLS